MQRMKDYVVNGTKEKRWNTVYSLFQLMVLNLICYNLMSNKQDWLYIAYKSVNYVCRLCSIQLSSHKNNDE
jgi:hypothetical protein